MAELAARGVRVTAMQIDVAKTADMNALFEQIERSGAPLRGVVHSAGVLDDGVLLDQTWSRVQHVMEPKLGGAWQLHRLTRSLNLDFFVLFSAGAAVLGSPGQAGYCAANLSLDAVAQARRSAGLPATSIAWGPWAHGGMAASMSERDASRWRERGVGSLSTLEGLSLLEASLEGVDTAVAALAMDWKRFSAAGPQRSRFDRLAVRQGPRAVAAPEAQAQLLARIEESPPAERRNVLAAFLRQQARLALGIDGATELDERRPLKELGLDSLMAVELRNALVAAVGKPMPVTLLFDFPTLAALGHYLGETILKLEARTPHAAAESGDAARHQTQVAAVARLSDAEAEALLLAELGSGDLPGMTMSAVPPGDELTLVKRALLEIRDLRARLAAAESAAREPVAIIGTGLRFPGGVRDLEGLWDLLLSGRDAITEIPRARWDIDALYDEDADAPGKMFTRHGAFIEDTDRFDAEFFGISPREAESMDPQQRILLETAWHAFEDAGIAPSSLYGSKTGVFLGVCNNDYGRMLFAHPERIDPYFSPGNAGSVVSGRLSYFLGAHGPSVTVDTACSSSLVALHLAVQSLRSGECDLALAGGINLILSPEMNINFSKGRYMARDGRCKTFDAAADGYVRGEGCGVVVLRRLRDCSATDRMLAVVRGSAINQDGRSGGLTAPNGPAQEAVIRNALASAAVAPAQIAYVEAHGTGTPLGDPIEVQALGAVLSEGRDAARPLAIGSIKTNIGHLEAAAGVAGIFKVVLALQHHEIPPHLHLNAPSPHIDWAAFPIVVPTTATPLTPIGGRLLAGVSSFGFSGTNAHVILEEVPAPAPVAAPAADRPQHVLALSARDAGGLSALAAAFAQRLQDASEPLADICFTANTGRAHFAHRLSVRADGSEPMRAALRAAANDEPAMGLVRGTVGERPRIAFLFTGGGAQSVGHGSRLVRAFEVLPRRA